jgi:hypothetical protein
VYRGASLHRRGLVHKEEISRYPASSVPPSKDEAAVGKKENGDGQ